MSKFVARFANDESGATAIEYGLIACLLSVGIIATLQLIGGELLTAYGKVGAGLVSGNAVGH